MPVNAQQRQRQEQEQRVSIVLDLPIDDMGTRELPFQLGIIGDFTGNDLTTLPANKPGEREFQELDNDSLPQTIAQVKERESRRNDSPHDEDAKRPTLFELMLPNLVLDDVPFEIGDELKTLLAEFEVNSQSLFPADAILPVKLEFQCMESFSPRQIIQQIALLKELNELRERLEGVKDILVENPDLETLISKWAKSAGGSR